MTDQDRFNNWDVAGKMPTVDPKGSSFADDVNATFVNQLSDAQLHAVLMAYEAGKAKLLTKYLMHVKPPYNNFMAYVTTNGDAEIIDVEILNDHLTR